MILPVSSTISSFCSYEVYAHMTVSSSLMPCWIRAYKRTALLTPFIVLSFLNSDSSLDVSSIWITILPLNSPSLLSMFIDLITIFSSLEMTLVMLFTMPMSSFPIILKVILYWEEPFPLHRAFTILYPMRFLSSGAFGQLVQWIFIPPFIVTNTNIGSPYLGWKHLARV